MSGLPYPDRTETERKNKRKLVILPILWLAAAGWVALCFYLSWQSGADTAEFSGNLSDSFLQFFQGMGISLDAAVFHGLLRRYAHLVVFFVAEVLFEGAFSVSFFPGTHWKRNASLWAFAVSSASAWIAETVKIWIPGRHFDLGETLLNEAGILCGIAAVWAVYGFFLYKGYFKGDARDQSLEKEIK